MTSTPVAWILVSGLVGSVLSLIGAWGLQSLLRGRDQKAIREQLTALMRATEVRMQTTAAEPKIDIANDVWVYWDMAFQIAMTPEGARAVAGHRGALASIVELQRGKYLLTAAKETRDTYRNSGSAAAFQAQYEQQLSANCSRFAKLLTDIRNALGDELIVAPEQNVIDRFRSR
jgi:hypothetical protein